MNITRIQENGVSRVEPPLRKWWSKLEKLQWSAAVTEHDEGIEIHVTEADYRIGGIKQRGYFNVSIVGGSSCGPFDYHHAWTYITGIGSGYRAGRRG